MDAPDRLTSGVVPVASVPCPGGVPSVCVLLAVWWSRRAVIRSFRPRVLSVPCESSQQRQGARRAEETGR
ncbi:hypothetical protein Taro_012759 [Colocasia esculenta]|uniref:Uncharacterized protein n=1 Tax=Colocasia esculenta TaxID=4460 RepID=A0A843U4U6_COLES|nr:hypothetical protein [Colocasia esculenta]